MRNLLLAFLVGCTTPVIVQSQRAAPPDAIYTGSIITLDSLRPRVDAIAVRRGVISAVRLKQAESTGPDPAGFSPDDLRVLQLVADILERLVEHELLTLSLGLGAGAW